MKKKVKNGIISCFMFLMLTSIGGLLLPSTRLVFCIQLTDGPPIPIYDVGSQEKIIVFTTDTIEWLGAYSANSRVTDINNDSIDDFFIGGNSMRVFFGHTSEWSNASVDEADATIINNLGPNQLTNPVGAGDVNNDGFPDFLAASFWSPVVANPITRAYLFFGGNASDWTAGTPVSDADVTFIAENAYDYFGHGMDGVGDVNNDGFDDFVITSEFNDQASNDAGKTYLVLGRATAAWNHSMDIGEAAAASFLGTETGGWLGINAAGVGDTNNDGFDDFLLGGATYSTDRIRENYLIFGRPTQQWQKEVPKTNVVNITFRFKTEDKLGGAAGRFMSGVGDVNNDSLDDFIVGAYKDDEGGSDTGQTFLFLGRSQGHWPSSPAIVNASDYANASFLGVTIDEKSGYSVSGAGDINADGYDDILIGASTTGLDVEGKAYVLFGRATNRWVMDQSLSEANLTFASDQFVERGSRFATDVSGIGDINNDGYADFSISAAWANGRQGLIFVIFGGLSWTPTTTPDTTITTTITTTTTQASPSWAPVLVLMSLAIVGFRKRHL